MGTYSNAFLNNAGQVSLEATLFSAGTNNRALFSDAGGTLTALAVINTGSPAGPDYLSFNELALADDGVSAFVTRTAAGDAHVTGDGTAVTLLVGAPPPLLAGMPLVDRVSTPALSSTGRLFSPARLEQGTGTPVVTVLNDTLIWDDQNGVVAREGEPAQDHAPGVTYSHLTGRVVCNDAGDIAFSGNLTGAGAARTALWSGKTNALTVLARRSDTAPGTGGAEFGTFYSESISPNGSVLFRGGLRFGGAVTSANNEGLWSNRNGSLELAVREDDLAPCESPEVRFGRFGMMSIDDDGTIFFHAFLKGVGVNSANDGSIWRSAPDGSLHLIARESYVANNTDGAQYASINPVASNNTGGVAFFARLVTDIGDTTSKNNAGVWRARNASETVPELIMRRGDTVTIGGANERVTLVEISEVANAVGGTGGYGRVLNAAGAAVITMSLTSRNGGVFIVP